MMSTTNRETGYLQKINNPAQRKQVFAAYTDQTYFTQIIVMLGCLALFSGGFISYDLYRHQERTLHQKATLVAMSSDERAPLARVNAAQSGELSAKSGKLFVWDNNPPDVQKLDAGFQVLLFVHVPKTGGGSLGMLVDIWLHHHLRAPRTVTEWFFCHGKPRYRQLGRTVAEHHVNFLWSHLRIDPANFVENFANFAMFTIVRHPLARVISDYNFKSDSDWSWARYLQSRAVCWNQTAFGEVRYDERCAQQHMHCNAMVEMFDPQPLWQPRFMCQRRYGTHEYQRLARAKENLRRRFFFVGVLEEWEQSLQILAKFFPGLDRMPSIQANKYESSDAKSEPSGTQMDQIKAYNSLDLDLYDWVRTQLFPQQVRYHLQR